MAPPFNRRIVEGLRAALRPEQRKFARAGNADGRRWTKFRETAQRLRRYVEGHPRCTLKQAISDITHHYATDASARGALVDLLKKNVVEGVALNPHMMTLHRPGDAEGLARRPARIGTLELFKATGSSR